MNILHFCYNDCICVTIIDFLKLIRYNTNENFTKVNGGFMNELDKEVIKEKYAEYKSKHYEDEREMRKLLKLKRLVPSLAMEENWKKDYKRLNDNLADGLYYYNELKKMLSEEELKEFVDKVKFKVLKERYVKFKLDQFEDSLYDELEKNEELFEEALNEETKVIPKVDKFDTNLFDKTIFQERELIKKVEIVCRYQKSTIDVFFDTTSILKAELMRLFIDRMNIEEIDKDELITACLVYAFKRTNSPKEIERIKREKEEDKRFLQSLGFDQYFCKICGEYNRYNEPENYEREKEGDILELIDKFVGLIMHRPERLAYSVSEALEIMDIKLLANIDNRYKNKFIKFIRSLEEIEVTRENGVITYLANHVNKNQRHDIASMIETILKIRDLLGGSVNEHKVMRLEKMEKVQDKFSIIQILQKIILRTKEKIASLSKILKGYKRLSEGSQEKEESFDR